MYFVIFKSTLKYETLPFRLKPISIFLPSNTLVMKKIYSLSFFTFLFLAITSHAQIFVNANATGANNGASWADAYTDLSDALSNSTPGDQVWVAAGTYKPGGANPDSTSTYSFPHDLELYGGFVGTETLLAERDWATNETILSGDHNDDDSDNDFFVNKSDNSLHVMFLTDTVTNVSTVDGFTIRNGNTQPGASSGDLRRGGGILTYGAPSVRNCYFTQNYGYFGGALYPRGTIDDIVVEDCIFENNRGQFGGGIYNLSNPATVTNCMFLGNYVDGRGGGFYTGTNCTVSDCTFTNNVAPSSSGGAFQVRSGNDPGDNPSVVDMNNCVFTGSNATFGGAIGSYDRVTTLNITDCEFSGNSAVNVGGCISNAFGANTNVSNTEFFLNNSPTANGGVIFSQNDSSVVNVIDCNIYENSSERGGAIAMSGDNEPLSTTPLPVLNIENTYILNNIAIEQGGAINFSNGILNVTNSIFDTNFATDADGIGGAISLNASDSISTVYTLINNTIVNNIANLGAGISSWKQGGAEHTAVLNLQNNIFYNPLGDDYVIEFGDPTVVSQGGNLCQDATLDTYLIGTNDLPSTDPGFVDFSNEDYHLADGSPGIDMGILAGAPLFDLEGNPRVDDVDMGVFENQKVVNTRDIRFLFGKLDIYPNPIQDDLNFAFESLWNGALEISVSNLEGKIIFTDKIEKTDRTVSRVYNVTKLPKGVYNLTITNGVKINTKRFMK